MPVTERARWYPSPAPALAGEDGEDGDAYTDRLTGADGTGRRPYDHPRGRQCSIGWHLECSGWRGASSCECPCHADRAPAGLPAGPADLPAGAVVLARLYGLPPVTALRVMALALAASDPAGRVPREDLTRVLGQAYACPQSAGFVTDVVNVCEAVIAGTLS